MKHNKKFKFKLKIIFIITMLSIGLIISYKTIKKSKIKIEDKDFINLVTSNIYSYQNDRILEQIISKSIDISNPIKILNKEYTNYIKTVKVKNVSKEINSPIIYIYNTHQTEEYAKNEFLDYTLNPTVKMNNYILEDLFNKKGYKTIVEEQSIKEILDNNNWNYAYSYKASRIFLEQSITNYPTLKYFIDIHRDSLTKDKTTININNKDYAQILFIVGLENKNYQANLEFTEKINNKINELYPGLSKGILKKEGQGVNGIYNQDFSPYTILIEIGGVESTTSEVLNTCIAFSECFLEVINE